MQTKVIRDPIHGDIRLNPLERELVDTPEFQRLRNIKQNGLCFLVYPAMNSTRFEHSLGVMYLMGVIADRLNLGEKPVLRVAGLLHDIGHCAFSHTSDDILEGMGYSHEENSSRIITENLGKILEKHDVSPKRVSNLILGKGELSKILSSEIDADKMDYLIRDSYYAGVAYGVIDLERIISSLKMIKRQLVVKYSGIEAAESLLISRNMMYQTVYRHHTKRIAETMFKHALASFVEGKNISREEFVGLDDIDLTCLLRKAGGYPQDITKRIDERKLFKAVCRERMDSLPKIRKSGVEEKIISHYKIEKGYLFVDIPQETLSEFKIKVEFDNELKSIDEVSPLARALEKSEREKLTIGVYVSPENVSRMKGFNLKDFL